MKNIDYTDEFLQRRKERQKKARKRRLVGWFIFVMILLLLVGVILSLTVFFPIVKLTFSGSAVYSSSQIADASGIDIGDNLFTVTTEGTLKTLKEKLPFIETVKLERTLPDTLKVTVTDAEKYACYEIDGKYYTVSKSGWVLEKTAEPSENIFLVKTNGVKCKVGSALEFESNLTVEKIEAITEYLTAEDISIDYINVTNDVNLIAKVENRFEVEFGTDNYLEAKVKHLKTMINTMEDGVSGKINLSMWNDRNRQATFVQNNTK